MLGPAETIRAARLAVAHYGAEAAGVQAVLHTVMVAQARGDGADLFDALVAPSCCRRGRPRTCATASTRRRSIRTPPTTSKIAAAQKRNEPKSNGQPLPEPPLGQLPRIAGYQVLRRLGEGGMGAVFLAYDSTTQRQVALKVLAPEHANIQGSLDRFRREGTSGQSLNHPNIVRNYGAGHDEKTGLHFLVLEYVDGPSAHDLLERFGRLKVGDAVHIILDVARALEHAHSSAIVHRDIKPANILLTASGVAKVSDLGLAKRTDETSHLTHAKQGVGTPYYMPYEQALNAKAADARSDLFALGATLYHLLTGDVPFPGHGPMDVMEKKEAGVYLPIRALNPEVPEALRRIVGRLLARRPEQRYASASELIVELERSQLAAAVPSFIDLDLALRDPLSARTADDHRPAHVGRCAGGGHGGEDACVGRLLVSPLQGPQRPAVQGKADPGPGAPGAREGKLSARVDAARSPQGEYRPIGSYTEFRDVVPPSRYVEGGRANRPCRGTSPNPARRHASRRAFPWPWVLAVTLSLGIIALLVLIGTRIP